MYSRIVLLFISDDVKHLLDTFSSQFVYNLLFSLSHLYVVYSIIILMTSTCRIYVFCGSFNSIKWFSEWCLSSLKLSKLADQFVRILHVIIFRLFIVMFCSILHKSHTKSFISQFYNNSWHKRNNKTMFSINHVLVLASS